MTNFVGISTRKAAKASVKGWQKAYSFCRRTTCRFVKSEPISVTAIRAFRSVAKKITDPLEERLAVVDEGP